MNSMITDSILSLCHDEARAHLMKGGSYSSIDLPSHFTFDAILSKIDNILQQISADELCKKFKRAKPGYKEKVNYSLYLSKDSRYAWRRFQLINPVLYVALVRHVTEESDWQDIQEKFKEFSRIENIECASLPLKSSPELPPRYWWKKVEQKSIELSLQFEHILTADLANCYDSIYTHSIAWALHTREVAKDRPNDLKLIGNKIDLYLKAMNHGQTNGIPTGSALMDLIAEMVLGHMDLELTKKLECLQNGYRILRYRDDYRIFVNNLTIGAEIMKSLTEVAMDWGFQLNSGKTKTSDNIIRASMKEDKIAWITRKHSQEKEKDPQEAEHKQSSIESTLLKNLLIIHDHSCQFPNAGSLIKALEQYHSQLKEDDIRIRPPATGVLVSVVVDIAYRNPLRWRPCVALLSELFSPSHWIDDEKRRDDIWEHTQSKLQRHPNAEYLELWLQRFAVPQEMEADYQGTICKLVDHLRKETSGSPPNLWNLDWVEEVHQDLKNLDMSSIVDLADLDAAGPTIPIDEDTLYY